MRVVNFVLPVIAIRNKTEAPECDCKSTHLVVIGHAI